MTTKEQLREKLIPTKYKWKVKRKGINYWDYYETRERAERLGETKQVIKRILKRRSKK